MSLPTTNGSEGDAYRYTKKVLLSLHNRPILESIYTEVAENRGISSWTRAAYMDLRATFFRDGQCKIRFAPGVARIAFGELDLGTGDEEPVNICSLRDMIRIISIAHCDDYTRHLVNKDGVELNYAKMLAIYGTKATANWALLKRRLKRMKYGQRRYKIIELTDFQVASQYYKYTEPHGWCHLHYEDTFKHYHMVNSSRIFSDRVGTNCIRLYLAVLPGFEDMKETDELYGESMLGIDIGPGGRLIHVNNRWNHAHDNVDERKGDNKYSEIELSMLLGGPFFEVCPPYSVSDEHRQLRAIRDEARKHNADLVKQRVHLTRLSVREFGKIGKRTTKYTDPRDNATYGVRKYGRAKFTSTPIHYIPEGSECIDLPKDWFDQCQKEDDTKHVYVLTIDPFNHNSLVWAENTSPLFNDLKQTAKTANPIGETKGDSLSWIQYPVEDLKYYTSYILNEAGRTPTVHQKVELAEQTQYMILPVSKNRAIYKNSETGKLEAIRFKHCIHVPILFIGSTVISLHPAYNDLAKKFDNPVLFPDNIDEFTNREIVSATPLPQSTSYHSSWTTTYSLTTTDETDNDETAMIDCGHIHARLIRRFVCDHIFGNVETAMAKEFPSCTAKDIDNVTHKLGLIFKDHTYTEYNTLPDASNKYRYSSCWTGNPLETAIINEIDPEINDTFADMHGHHTAEELYDEVIQHSIGKPNHNILYDGITANGTRFKPITGLLYLDIEYAKTAIDHIRPRSELNLTELVDQLFLSVVTPVWQPNGFGYASTVVAEKSSIPVNDVEATIYSIKSKPDSIIRIGHELCLYPNKLASQLENDTLRFPDSNDIYSYLSAVGFKINDSDLLPKSALLRKNETADAEDDFREMFMRHMRGLAHVDVIPETTAKPKKRGIKIPEKLASYFAYPTIRRQFDDATHLDAVHLGVLFSTSNINDHMHRYAYIPEIIKEVNRLGLSLAPAKPNALHVEISRDSRYNVDQTSTNYLTVTVESPRFGSWVTSSTKDVNYVMPYMVVKDVKKTA